MDSSFHTPSSVNEELRILDEATSQKMHEFIQELASISLLTDGWYGEQSLAPTEATIIGSRALAAPLLFHDLPFPLPAR